MSAKKSDPVFTEIVPAFLVRGVAVVDMPGGASRRVQVSRIMPAPTPEAARVAALSRVAHRLRGPSPVTGRTRWQEVTVRWIANQYMWTFEEKEPQPAPAGGELI